ncbi:hypothetical protein [Bradyrhizobium erythrophlei]|uniref:hypothetical protein n=1 Tax=Bradyrhizobium erythrophlei TaxID=1437360 RepID=UPI00115FC7E8|nr:hypothetical protein [Bradyrhizobium erythrophlei]
MMTTRDPDKLALRIASLVTAINVVVACGFSVAGLISPSAILPTGSSPTAASQVFAMYAAARAVPLTLITLATLGRRLWMLPLGTLAGVVQLLDAGVGLLQHDIGKTIGPLTIAVLQFLALLNLTRGRKTSASDERI